HVELRISHFDAHLIFKLLQTHLRLAQFKLGAHLVCLRGPVQNGHVERNSHSFIWSCRTRQLTQGVAVAYGTREKLRRNAVLVDANPRAAGSATGRAEAGIGAQAAAKPAASVV